MAGVPNDPDALLSTKQAVFDEAYASSLGTHSFGRIIHTRKRAASK